MNKQKQSLEKQKQRKSNTNRSSDEFVYNPDIERHIGKRTGNYFYRPNPKEHYDGFPRFSQYQSHRDTQSSSLAREIQSRTSNSISNYNASRLSGQSEPKVPFATKQSPIITPLENNTSSRVPDINLPGFGQFDISTIKRRSSAVRPSEIKSYKDLLNELETDEFKQFIFNEQEIEESAKKQVVQQEEKKKKKKEHRVSFKENPIEIQYSENSKNESNKAEKKLEKEKQKKQQQQQQKIPEKKIQNNVRLSEFNKKQQEVPQDTLLIRLKKLKQDQNIITNEDEVKVQYNDYVQLYDNADNETLSIKQPQTNSEPPKEEIKVEKKKGGKRGRKKSIRITDDPTNQNSEEQKGKEKGKKQKQKNKNEGGKKNQKGRIARSQTLQQKKSDERTRRSQNNSKKLKTRSLTNEYLQQLASDHTNENDSNLRYPKRTRIKPVQFWQCERVHYKAGKAIGIERANIHFTELLQLSQNFEHRINVNFHSHDIEVDLTLPAKKQMNSIGVKDPYEYMEIQINQQKHAEQDEIQLYFDDGVRSQKVTMDQPITVPSHRYFELMNKSKIPVYLLLKFKVKETKIQ